MINRSTKMAEYDEYDWTPFINSNNFEAKSLAKGLSEIEETLRCAICRDFMTSPVLITRCCHTFCSTCIRSALGTTNGSRTASGCPVCRANVTTNDLKSNNVCYSPTAPAMASTIDSFLRHRSIFLKLATNLVEKGKTDLLITDHERSSPSSREERNNLNKNQQPILEGEVPSTKIPVVNFGSLKTKTAIQKKLAEFGLLTTGNREIQEWRIKKFVTVHNSFVDGGKSVHKAIIAAQIESEEKELEKSKRQQKMSEGCVRQLKEGIVPAPVQLSFQEMTKSLRNRMMKEKGIQSAEKKSEDDLNDEMPSIPSSSSSAISSSSSAMISLPNRVPVRWFAEKPWRVIWSEKHQQPFFYNQSTDMGQWHAPSISSCRPLSPKSARDDDTVPINNPDSENENQINDDDTTSWEQHPPNEEQSIDTSEKKRRKGNCHWGDSGSA